MRTFVLHALLLQVISRRCFSVDLGHQRRLARLMYRVALGCLSGVVARPIHSFKTAIRLSVTGIASPPWCNLIEYEFEESGEGVAVLHASTPALGGRSILMTTYIRGYDREKPGFKDGTGPSKSRQVV